MLAEVMRRVRVMGSGPAGRGGDHLGSGLRCCDKASGALQSPRKARLQRRDDDDDELKSG
jgi:hypothetical protein